VGERHSNKITKYVREIPEAEPFENFEADLNQQASSLAGHENRQASSHVESQAEVSENEAKPEILEAEIVKKDDILDASILKIESLEERENEVLSKVKDLESALTEEEKRNAKLDSELFRTKKESEDRLYLISQLEAQVSGHDTELGNLQVAIGRKDKILEAALLKIQSMETRENEVISKVKGLEIALADAQKKNAKLGSDLSRTEEENKSHLSRVSNLEEQLSQSSARFQKIEIELENMKNKLSVAKDTIGSLTVAEKVSALAARKAQAEKVKALAAKKAETEKVKALTAKKAQADKARAVAAKKAQADKVRLLAAKKAQLESKNKVDAVGKKPATEESKPGNFLQMLTEGAAALADKDKAKASDTSKVESQKSKTLTVKAEAERAMEQAEKAMAIVAKAQAQKSNARAAKEEAEEDKAQAMKAKALGAEATAEKGKALAAKRAEAEKNRAVAARKAEAEKVKTLTAKKEQLESKKKELEAKRAEAATEKAKALLAKKEQIEAIRKQAEAKKAQVEAKKTDVETKKSFLEVLLSRRKEFEAEYKANQEKSNEAKKAKEDAIIPKLYNWTLNENGGVEGTVLSHPTIDDGNTIVTSALLDTDNAKEKTIVTTDSGSKYRLGTLPVNPRPKEALNGLVVGDGKYLLAGKPTYSANRRSAVWTGYRAGSDGSPRGAPLAVKISPNNENMEREYANYERINRRTKQVSFVNHVDFFLSAGTQGAFLKQSALVMERGNENLKEHLRRTGHALEGEALREAAKSALQCIAAVHSTGLVWTDVKAENFIVMEEPSEDGVTVKGIDLESCMPVKGNPVDYSPEGCPPEFASAFLEGEGYDFVLDYNYDVWSFGMLMYEMSTGRGFFDGKSPTQVVKMLCDFEPNLDKVPDPEVVDLIGKCLHLDPTKRPSVAKILKHPYFSDGSISSSPFSFLFQ